jgi:hypothetical protein
MQPSSPPQVSTQIQPSLKSSNFSIALSDIKKRRKCLAVMGVVVTIGIIIGIVFSAHYYFHIFDGQGFLKSRHSYRNEDDSRLAVMFLLMRRRTKIDSSATTIPFYVCGDQENSCEAFHLPVSIILVHNLCLLT